MMRNESFYFWTYYEKKTPDLLSWLSVAVKTKSEPSIPTTRGDLNGIRRQCQSVEGDETVDVIGETVNPLRVVGKTPKNTREFLRRPLTAIQLHIKKGYRLPFSSGAPGRSPNHALP
ncbi:hypothetical protein J6590_029994 [Homalodisca vitripennis]|nr:hypothetical protein J6590_029994 [Homalodisca vitripennis]